MSMDLELRISADRPPECWTDLLDRGEGYPILHSAARMAFCTWEEHRTPLFALFRRKVDGEAVALAGIDQYTPDVPIAGQWLKYWRLDAVPVVLPAGSSPNIRADIMRTLENAARRHGALILRCSSRGGVFGWGETLSRYDTDESYEFVLTPQPEPELRSGLSSGRKSDLNKAVRNEVVIRRIDAADELDGEAVRELETIEGDTVARSRSIGRSQDYVGWGDARWYRALARTLVAAGEAHVFVARSRYGDLIGTAVLLRDHIRGYVVHAAYSSQGYETGAPTLLWWELFLFAHRRGLLSVNLGAVPVDAEKQGSPDHGLYRFKQSFGADPHPYLDMQEKTGPGRLRLLRMVRPSTYR